MDTDAMTAYYWKNLKDIPQRQLADNDEYHALIQKKIAAENALKVLISEEAWRRYLELDAISNELESVRLEAVYKRRLPGTDRKRSAPGNLFLLAQSLTE